MPEQMCAPRLRQDEPAEICDEFDDDLVDGEVEDEDLVDVDVNGELEPDGEFCPDAEPGL